MPCFRDTRGKRNLDLSTGTDLQDSALGRRMGHAGAIISPGSGDALSKMRALEHAGAFVVENPAKIGETIAKISPGIR